MICLIDLYRGFYLLFTICAATWQNQQNGCAPSEDSDQRGHPPSLIRVFDVCKKKARVLSCPLSAQRRLWTDWANAQADLSLRCAHTHLLVLSCRGSFMASMAIQPVTVLSVLDQLQSTKYWKTSTWQWVQQSSIFHSETMITRTWHNLQGCETSWTVGHKR